MMNDFTKEELEYLYGAIYERPNSVTPEMDEVRHKIQSLIDRYSECQHQKIVTGAYPRSNPPKKCKSCGAMYYE